MPKDSPGERLATLEANVKNMLLSLDRIEEYMQTGEEQRITNAVKLGKIEECVIDFKDYQVACDKERDAHRERLGELEEDNRFIRRTTTWVGSFVGLVVTALEGYRFLK